MFKKLGKKLRNLDVQTCQAILSFVILVLSVAILIKVEKKDEKNEKKNEVVSSEADKDKSEQPRIMREKSGAVKTFRAAKRQ
jgi:hypothetical protein